MRKFLIAILSVLTVLSCACAVGCTGSGDGSGDGNTPSLGENVLLAQDFETRDKLRELEFFAPFGKFALNTDTQYVKTGKASLKLQPVGYGLGLENSIPKMAFDLKYIEAGDKNLADFSMVEKISFEVYNSDSKERSLWLTLLDKGNNKTVRQEYKLAENAWTTVSYDINYSYMCLMYDMKNISQVQVEFEPSRYDEEIAPLYMDTFALHYTKTVRNPVDIVLGENEICDFEQDWQGYVTLAGIVGGRGDISNTPVVEICNDPAYASSGNRSLKVNMIQGGMVGDSFPYFMLSDKLLKAIDFTKYDLDDEIVFDVYLDRNKGVKLSSAAGFRHPVYVDLGTLSRTEKFIPSRKWTEYKIRLGDIASAVTGKMEDLANMDEILVGYAGYYGENAAMYIDNIRVETYLPDLEGLEKDYAWDAIDFTASAVEEKSSNATSFGAFEGEKYADYTFPNGKGGATYNFKFDTTKLTTLMADYDALSFDVYVYSDGSYVDFYTKGTDKGNVKCGAGEWTTVTVNIADITANAEDGFNVVFHGGSYTYLAIDNFRGAYSYELDAGASVNLSDKVTALKQKYSADSVDFKVKNSIGLQVVAGVNASAYTFAPNAAGKYTVELILNKANYKPYKVYATVLYDYNELFAEDCAFDAITSSGLTGAENTETVTEGKKAWALSGLTANSAYTLVFDLDKLANYIAYYDNITFSVYANGGNVTFKNDDKVIVVAGDGEWTKVTVPANALNAITMTADATATVIVDNFAGENDAIKFDEGAKVDLTEIISDLGTVTSVEVSDEYGYEANDLLNGYVLSPESETAYLVKVTVVKSGYVPFVVEYTVVPTIRNLFGTDYAWNAAYCPNNGNIQAVESDKFVKEGKKSVKLFGQNDGYYGYSLNVNKLSLIAAAYDSVTFDVYVESSRSVQIYEDSNGKSIKTCPANEWTTLTVKIEEFGTWKGIVLNGSATAIYFDNFRGGDVDKEIAFGTTFDVSDRISAIKTTGCSVVLSVEDEKGAAVTEGLTQTSFTAAKEGVYKVIFNVSKEGYRDAKIAYNVTIHKLDFFPEDFAWNIIRLNDARSNNSSGTDSSYLKEGSKYAYYTVKVGDDGCYDGYTINTDYLTEVSKMYDSIAFDVYVEKGGVNISTNGWAIDLVLCEAGKWTTVTVKIANIPANIDKNCVIPVTEEGKYFVIDNVRGVNSEKSATVGSEFSLTEKVNELTTNGYTVKSVKFYTEAGAEVASANNAFTPSAAGKYVAKITVSKAGYNDYAIEVPITCG